MTAAGAAIPTSCFGPKSRAGWAPGRRELLDAGAAWVDRQGVRKTLTLGDVLVVAPYNAHVATPRARLPEGARVGTVDKFQGQDGPSCAVDSLGDALPPEHVMASPNTFDESESPEQITRVVEAQIRIGPTAENPAQKRSASPHPATRSVPEPGTPLIPPRWHQTHPGKAPNKGLQPAGRRPTMHC